MFWNSLVIVDFGAFLKKAREEGRTVVFVDESGLWEPPQRANMASTRADFHSGIQFQLVQALDHLWSQLVGVLLPALSACRHRGGNRGFLERLRRQIGSRLLVIWDGLPAHCSRRVRRWLEAEAGEVVEARLPA